MHILITGASSGLGAALALEYADEDAVLSLCGRNESRLLEVAERARAKGAKVYLILADVTNAREMEDWIKQAYMRAPLDLVIANAGVSAGTGGGDESRAQAFDIFGTNVEGVLNTVYPVLSLMRTRGKGQIALMSSLAGFRGMPGAPSYCASKAAVRVFGEALRGTAVDEGVKINVICPGFIKTPMTDVNGFSMPFLMKPERAARIIRLGLERNRGRISFPWPMTALVWLLYVLPVSATDALLQKLPKKP